MPAALEIVTVQLAVSLNCPVRTAWSATHRRWARWRRCPRSKAVTAGGVLSRGSEVADLDEAGDASDRPAPGPGRAASPALATPPGRRRRAGASRPGASGRAPTRGPDRRTGSRRRSRPTRCRDREAGRVGARCRPPPPATIAAAVHGARGANDERPVEARRRGLRVLVGRRAGRPDRGERDDVAVRAGLAGPQRLDRPAGREQVPDVAADVVVAVGDDGGCTGLEEGGRRSCRRAAGRRRWSALAAQGSEFPDA